MDNTTYSRYFDSEKRCLFEPMFSVGDTATLYYRRQYEGHHQEIYYSIVFLCYCGRVPHIFSLGYNRLWSVHCPFCKNENGWNDDATLAFKNWNDFRRKQLENLNKILK